MIDIKCLFFLYSLKIAPFEYCFCITITCMSLQSTELNINRIPKYSNTSGRHCIFTNQTINWKKYHMYLHSIPFIYCMFQWIATAMKIYALFVITKTSAFICCIPARSIVFTTCQVELDDTRIILVDFFMVNWSNISSNLFIHRTDCRELIDQITMNMGKSNIRAAVRAFILFHAICNQFKLIYSWIYFVGSNKKSQWKRTMIYKWPKR